MATVLLYGDTVRYPSLRHEVPLEIVDPLMFAEHDGRLLVLTSALEGDRIEEALPEAEVRLREELGMIELVKEGMPRDDAELEVAVAALRRWGIDRAVVPADMPVAVADRLRAEGFDLVVDGTAVEQRRRAKSNPEMEGIRRAQRAAEAGMAAAQRMIHGAERADGRLHHDGAELTAEDVRAAAREACAAAGAPAPPTIMVVSLLSGGGHDPGSGPLPADKPIEVDLWPRDEASGCWADMTRTFVNGEVSDEVRALAELARAALEAARAAAHPGMTGRELYDRAADVIEEGGWPTQRSHAGEGPLTHGFYFSLGHGVGLEVHEPPRLGLGGDEPLVAGDVLAVEPGIEGVEDVGGVRFEDLLLITEDGCETLTEFPYEL